LADFSIWKTEYLTKVGKTADFNKTNIVDLADFYLWKLAYLN
jgi:hypothetical protein